MYRSTGGTPSVSPEVFKLGSIILIGISCEWLADRMGIPSILVLLAGGFLAGPVTGFLSPDKLFGDFLFPIVSLSMAIILFEGGLRLRLKNYWTVSKAILSLTTLGAIITACLSALLGWTILQFELDVAILFGTIMVITGPTVILPLLRSTNLKRRIRTISIWEGIINDPLGAILTVVVFELAVVHNPPGIILFDGIHAVFWIIAIGVSAAFAGSFLLGNCLKQDWIPDHLRNPVTLAFVLLVFMFCEWLRSEAGLVATPTMGVILANRTDQKIQKILRFKKELGVILLSTLFIILTARFDLQGFREIGIESFTVLILLILIVRPISVLLSTLPTNITWRETVALGFFAPRGIISAVISSLYALRLADMGYPNAGHLDSEVFFIIAGTVLFYGLCAPPLFQFLGLVKE